jgi:hypothetical protein
MWERIALLFLTTVCLSPLRPVAPENSLEYRVKSGDRVIVTSKKAREATPESTLRFYSPQSQRRCSLDFSSEDGEHGFGVVRAAWTPDESYFVFSLTSSGGHQAWHSPTVFYNLRDTEIYSLDSYTTAAGISKGLFTLKPPSTVLTEVWRGESVPAKFRLDSLMDSNRKSQRSLRCADGKVFRVDPYDLQNHD